MSESLFKRLGKALQSYTILVATAAVVGTTPVAAQGIERGASDILTAMSDNLKSMATLRADYDTDHEIIDLSGRKIQYSASGSIALDRAKGFRMSRKGPFADADVIFDGEKIFLYGKALNVYAEIASPGPAIEDATEEFRISTGIDAPGADLLASDPYSLLIEGAVDGIVVGTAFVNGVECDHLAFRTDTVDWQIWVSKGPKPVPMKYVITTKWLTGAPQYSVRLSNWKNDGVDPAQFKFVPPATAKKVEQVYADVTGELTLEVAP